MLHSCPSIVIDILLDLTDPLAWSWLTDRHLDGPLPISDHHRTEAAVLCADLARGKREGGRRGKRTGGREGKLEHECSAGPTILSSTDQKRWNCSVLMYHLATGSICRSGWFPTTWSTTSRLEGGLREREREANMADVLSTAGALTVGPAVGPCQLGASQNLAESAHHCSVSSRQRYGWYHHTGGEGGGERMCES